MAELIFKKTKIKGVYLIEPELLKDNRGYFTTIYDQSLFQTIDPEFKLVQINYSYNKSKGTIRGMHFQKKPRAQAKIVQCLKGAIYDIVVDLRKKSKTYGQWLGEELSQDNKKMLYVPIDFAHGFQTLTNNCVVQYFMSDFYAPEYAGGVRWNDPAFKIKWPLPVSSISPKDKIWLLSRTK